MLSHRIVALFAGVTLYASTSAAATIDLTTQGNWIGKYGNDGYILPDYNGPLTTVVPASPTNDIKSLPGYVGSYDYTNALEYVWTQNENHTPDIQNPANPNGPRNATTAFNNGTFSVNINLSQDKTFQLGVYGLDWEGAGRITNVSVNGDTATFSDPAYYNGEWALFNVSGKKGDTITIDVTQANNSPQNATISAITFDSAVPEPASVLLAGLGIGGLGLARALRRRLA